MFERLDADCCIREEVLFTENMQEPIKLVLEGAENRAADQKKRDPPRSCLHGHHMQRLPLEHNTSHGTLHSFPKQVNHRSMSTNA